MSALRSFDAWLVAHEIVADAPAAFKAERLAMGHSIASASRQMVGVSPYMLRKFEDGIDIHVSDLRSILLWLAGARNDRAASVHHSTDPTPRSGHDESCAEFYPEYGAPEGDICKVCGESTHSTDPAHPNGSTT